MASPRSERIYYGGLVYWPAESYGERQTKAHTMKKRLLWQIYPAFLIITVLGLLLISMNVSTLLKNFYYGEKHTQLEKMANLGLSSMLVALESGDPAQTQHLCSQMGSVSHIRYTVIDLNGKVLGDSDEVPEDMVNHFDRPEFQTALTGQVGNRVRSSETLSQEMMYVAVPVKNANDTIVAVLRTSVATPELQAAMKSVYRDILRYGLMITVLLAVLSLLFSWKLSRPLNLLRQGAERFAAGDLNHRLAVSESQEIGALADSMNKMAGQLDERIRTIIAQKNEQQAVLSSMIEGVIAVSVDGAVLSLNNAAAEMLGESMDQAVGRSVEEVVRNTDLQRFVRRALNSDEPVEAQIILHENNQREQHLQAHGTLLTGDAGKVGVLIVMNDVTHIRRLEQVRRDFVANVSHELKTPVTSIKGFIETLLDGAMNKPEDSRRFLEIIARQTDRLNSIIDDLLTLSRVEQQSERAELTMEPVKLKSIMNAAVSLCEIKATGKNIHIQVDCDESIQVNANASLLEQAIVNLVDNAIKYSDPDSEVRIEVARADQEICLSVHDQGCGIAKDHLPRLFERFYRIDKARSRSLGGTGLGLAIVKHIVQSHKGRVEVESILGEGSNFKIFLAAENT